MPSSDPLAGLNVSISQGTTSPPTIVATVKNNNPHSVTIAPYQSPFDGLILEQGNLFIFPGATDGNDSDSSSTTSSKPLDYPTIALKRAWPPPSDSLVTLGPGESRTTEIVIRHPVPVRQLGSSATVKLSGQWMSVWKRPKEEIGDADWDDVSNPDEFSGLYESNSLEILIA
ncbi:uncharacterized protein TRIVIDRAFT_215186 [Trichoderma virens Gv29-8]|uniref:Uncharacterized protein n=1 Tax=Hypocrea virens (strain Gv29-8 / FGSC 10586) TaxID=413071 RepID=G9MH86_HYPVG|nr:uncharacterized protein TRIVIDRAFT_215186 [Trichoderma virens Gv29-8]EHK26074.1 hypothetical protein TRIVIDRAFT_215186 [Trichoderma virens Gv29-8]UKZ46263.1 hypothetical protein TrVGV298_000464 [Trichoderma virens]UKZ72848.1 hypothetical protein TrVFT333_000485 [Trichoderma virens FT-333]